MSTNRLRVEMTNSTKQKRKSAKQTGAKSEEKKKKSAKQAQKKELNARVKKFENTRMRRSAYMCGLFSSICERIVAEWNIWVYSTSPEINDCFIQAVFPRSYKPTWGELFQALAHQTIATYDSEYDAEADCFYWKFEPLADDVMRVPYGFNFLPEDWSVIDAGIALSYKPPSDVYPVGIDIYYFGTYSFDTTDEKKRIEKFEEIRNDLAECFARSVVKYTKINPPTAQEMVTKKIGRAGIPALYFESPCSLSNAKWRQWVFVSEGYCLGIGTCLEADVEKIVLPEMEQMVLSFSTKCYVGPDKDDVDDENTI